MPAADTIAAVASPPGRSVRGLIRASGPAVDRLIQSHLDRPLPPGELAVGRLRLGLPCLALYQPRGRSFTGEPTLELWLPGGPAVLERVLHGLTAEPGVRLAEAGEFTRRAFFAGRLTLTEAEGIAATISAECDAQLSAAGKLRRGELGRWAVDLADRLANLLALVEAGIDFTDQEDVVPIAPDALASRIGEMKREVESLLSQSRAWSQLESLPRVVLAGEPNAGKSTLFNALLGRTRAVTSDISGTTRDVLAEPLRLDTPRGAVEVMLVDIAGLDTAQGVIDEAMQTAAHEALSSADLVVWLEPASRRKGVGGGAFDRFNPSDGAPAYQHGPTPPQSPPVGGRPDGALVVRSKCDLSPADGLAVSAIAGVGLDRLRSAIADRLADRAVSVAGEQLALRARHREAIAAAADALGRSLAHDEAELIAESLRRALDALGELAGHIDPDEVIGRVFAEFCIGK